MRRTALAGAAGVLLLAGLAATSAQDGSELPDGPGREDVVAWCSGCHSMALVTQQGMSRARWDETITWMVKRQNMPEPTEQERRILLDYLAAHFGEAKGGGCMETPWGRRCR